MNNPMMNIPIPVPRQSRLLPKKAAPAQPGEARMTTILMQHALLPAPYSQSFNGCSARAGSSPSMRSRCSRPPPKSSAGPPTFLFIAAYRPVDLPRACRRCVRATNASKSPPSPKRESAHARIARREALGLLGTSQYGTSQCDSYAMYISGIHPAYTPSICARRPLLSSASSEHLRSASPAPARASNRARAQRMAP
jgi:hypothetical protein